MPDDRFGKLEDKEPAAGIVKKQPQEQSRFAHLEVPGEAQERAVSPPIDAQAPKLVPCPKCGRTNRGDTLYCIYCGYVFPDRAEKTADTLEVYEIRCPACGRTAHRSQKTCLWCGYRFVPSDEDILKSGEEMVLVIDGDRFSSKDPYLPKHIRQAMVRLKKEGISPSDAQRVAHTVAEELRREQAAVKFAAGRMAENARLKVIGGSFVVAGIVLTATGRSLLRLPSAPHLAGWALTLLAAGGLAIIVGLGTLAAAGMPADQLPGRRES